MKAIVMVLLATMLAMGSCALALAVLLGVVPVVLAPLAVGGFSAGCWLASRYVEPC